MAGKSLFSGDLEDKLSTVFGLMSGIGNVWYVDSGNSAASDDSGAGRTKAIPFATFSFAVKQITANNGDLMFVFPGHTETITVAAGVTMNTAGLTVIGLGNGTDRPTFNFTTATTADFGIDAANITLQNLFFDMTGVDALVAGIDVNAAHFQMIGCEVLMSDSGGQAVSAVDLDANADNCRLHRCTFIAPNSGADEAIRIGGALTNLQISECWIDGDFLEACIENPTGNIATQLLIRDCYLKNDNAGEHSIQLVSNCTGMLVRNYYVNSLTQATGVDPGLCRSFECYHCDTTDVSGILAPVAT